MKVSINNQSLEVQPFSFEEKLSQTMSYEQYMDMIKKELKVADLPDKEIDDGMIGYARMNMHRMERWNKTLVLEEANIKAISSLEVPITFLVISESWCGDAAHVLPVVQKLSETNSLITVNTILRDEHPDLMDEYLTNGSRSIPVVICLVKTEGRYMEVFRWGPKPVQMMEKLQAFKNGSLNMNKEEFLTDTQRWYNQDKTKSIQKELIEKLKLSDLI